MKLTLLYFLLAFVILCSFSKCSKDNNDPVEEESAVSYESLFTDTLYQKGFNVSSTQGGNSTLAGILDYAGTTTGSPFWKIAQWYCYNNDLTEAQYSVSGEQLCYAISNEGNKVYVDTAKGYLTLELNTDTEYGLNGSTSNPRESGQVWPHLLIEHNWDDASSLKISDKEELLMDISYEILKCDDKIPAGKVDASLHAAQFQWYITVQNRNSSSAGYGSEYIWFGLSFFDNRYDYSPLYAAEDGGKEENTGAFIYTPAMQPILSDQGKTEIGKEMKVKVDILPLVKSAYELARERNYLSNTDWDDLYIGSTNIGWEVPGTYNVSVKISKLNIRYR